MNLFLQLLRANLPNPDQGNQLETVAIVPHSTPYWGGNGETLALPILTEIDNFSLLPAAAVAAGTDPFVTLVGTNTPVAAQDTKGGVSLTTGATNTNQAAIAGVATTGFSFALTTTNGVQYRSRVNLKSLATMYASSGINSLATDVNPMATNGDGAAFLADPTNALTATHGATAAQALNWILCYKVNGVFTYAFTSIPLVAGLDVRHQINVNPDYTCSMYIDGVLVGTSPALTAAAVVKPLIGVRTLAAATAQVSARFVIYGRNIG